MVLWNLQKTQSASQRTGRLGLSAIKACAIKVLIRQVSSTTVTAQNDSTERRKAQTSKHYTLKPKGTCHSRKRFGTDFVHVATDIHELAILFDASGLRVSDVSFKEGAAVVGSGAVLEVLQATKHTGYMYMYMDMWLSIYLSFSLSLYIYICTHIYIHGWIWWPRCFLSYCNPTCAIPCSRSIPKAYPPKLDPPRTEFLRLQL